VSHGFLAASVHLVLFAMVVRLFSLQRTRDHYMLAVLSFLMVLAARCSRLAAVPVLVAFFLLVAVITFVLMEMRHSLPANPRTRRISPYGSAGRRALPPHGVWTAGGRARADADDPGRELSDLLPSTRVSSRFLTAYTPTSDVATVSATTCNWAHRPDSAIQCRRHAHRDPERFAGRLRLEMARDCVEHFRWANLDEFLRPDSTAAGWRWKLSAGAFEWPEWRIDGGGAIHSLSRFDGAARNQRVLSGGKPQRLIGNFRQVTMDSGGAVYDLDADHPINRYEAESQLAQPDSEELRLAPNFSPGGGTPRSI